MAATTIAARVYIHQDCQAKGGEHVQPLEAEQAAAVVVIAAGRTVLGQRRVQADDVRHHGGTEDRGLQVQRARSVQAGHQAMQRAGNRRTDPEGLIGEAGSDKPEQRDYGQLEPPAAPGPQPRTAKVIRPMISPASRIGTPNSRFSRAPRR
jgi:hypothetical protein